MPSWVSRNVGLNQSVNYMVIHPKTRGLASQNHILLAATDGGIYSSSNGGRQWAQIVLPDPTGGGATISELTFHWVEYNPLNNNIVFALGVKSSAGQLWLYKSSDNLLTWTSRLVATS